MLSDDCALVVQTNACLEVLDSAHANTAAGAAQPVRIWLSLHHHHWQTGRDMVAASCG